MYAIELYKTYLTNSTNGLNGTAKIKKLIYEKEKISDILAGIDKLFYNDEAVKDRKDHTIYTVIKRDIIADALSGSPKVVIDTSKFLLQGILNDMENMKSKRIA